MAPGTGSSRKRSAAALAAAACVAVGCGGERQSPYFGHVEGGPTRLDALTINCTTEPQYIDPTLVNDNLSQQLAHALFEGLTTPHPRDLHPVQGVAHRWERSEDGRIYRFHLRPEARWSDGRPVLARDFVYSWRRLVRPETGSMAAPDLHPLKNAERISRSLIRVARRDLDVRPLPGTAGGASVKKGEAVFVISPAQEGRAGAVIARYSDAPTFSVPAPAPAPSPSPIGLVDEADLGPGDALLGVRATDDLTLDVELERPTPYFLDLTSRATLVPLREDVIEPFEARGERDFWTRPGSMVNNGPFVISDWRFHYGITMKPNPLFWARASIRLKSVEWQEIDSAFTAMNLFKTGELDAFGSSTVIPLKSRESSLDKKDLVRFSQLFSYWYDLNTRVPPLDDARVRRALGLSLDRRALVERVLRDAALPATHYIPEITGGGYSEAIAAERAAGVDPFADRAPSPERARELLAEAGFPVERDGDDLQARGFPRLELLYNGEDDAIRSVAVAIQDMWRREIGVTVTLHAVEWKILLDQVGNGQFQIARGGWIADYNHPHTFLETFRSASPQNATGWADPAFDAALERAARASDPAEGMRLYRQAEGLALDGQARIPLFFMGAATLVKPWVKGFYGNGQVLDLVRWMWIDPAWREHQGNSPASAPLELPPPETLRAP